MKISLLILFLFITVLTVKAQNFTLKSNDLKGQAKMEQVLNSSGSHEFGGPCPPTGDGIHEYIFTIYALKVSYLDLAKDASSTMVGSYINANTTQKASLAIYYERAKEDII